MAVFKGAGVAIATPFDENNKIDFDRFGTLIDYQVDHHTDAIIVCGTTGEASTMTHAEHIETIRYCVERVAGRIPVVAGTGSNMTETAVHLTKAAEEAGADGALLVTPYYNKATQKGLIGHFSEIAANTSLPIILYNVPSRTGCKLEAPTIATLVKNCENIVGIKEATGSLAFAAEVLYETQGDIDLYSGNDDVIVPILSLGGKGVISVLSNVAPDETHEMCQAYFDGNVDRARELQLKYTELIRALFCEVNPIPVKKALELMGFYGPNLRMPLSEMEPEHTERLVKAMKDTGILA